MNVIIRQAGISFVKGAAYTAGAWLTKQLLTETKRAIVNNSKKQEEVEPVL